MADVQVYKDVDYCHEIVKNIIGYISIEATAVSLGTVAKMKGIRSASVFVVFVIGGKTLYLIFFICFIFVF